MSGDFRRDADFLGLDLGGWEHGVEAFYNVAFTPAMGLSFNVQYMNGPNVTVDDSVLLGMRLQLDF